MYCSHTCSYMYYIFVLGKCTYFCKVYIFKEPFINIVVSSSKELQLYKLH